MDNKTTPATPAPAGAHWTDDELYQAYLCGCEDECLPGPMSRTMLLAQFTGEKS